MKFINQFFFNMKSAIMKTAEELMMVAVSSLAFMLVFEFMSNI